MDDKDIQDKFDTVNKELAELAVTENTNKTNIENIKEDISKIENKVDDLTKSLITQKEEIIAGVKAEFVKYVEFEPVKTLVYGMVGGILLSVLVAVLALVIVPVVQGSSPLTPGVSIVKSHGQ